MRKKLENVADDSKSIIASPAWSKTSPNGLLAFLSLANVPSKLSQMSQMKNPRLQKYAVYCMPYNIQNVTMH